MIIIKSLVDHSRTTLAVSCFYFSQPFTHVHCYLYFLQKDLIA